MGFVCADKECLPVDESQAYFFNEQVVWATPKGNPSRPTYFWESEM